MEETKEKSAAVQYRHFYEFMQFRFRADMLVKPCGIIVLGKYLKTEKNAMATQLFFMAHENRDVNLLLIC